jgi:hypothetical protein
MEQMKAPGPSLDQSGQAVAEYILLLAITVVAFGVLMNAVNTIGVMKLLTSPIQDPFRRAYAYGHPLATTPDDTGPGAGQIAKHPKLGGRLFYVLH